MCYNKDVSYRQRRMTMKRSAPTAARRALAWLLCVLMLAGTILTALPVSAAEVNIARGKTAIACHSESGSLTPNKALDGNSGTRFAAGGDDHHRVVHSLYGGWSSVFRCPLA